MDWTFNFDERRGYVLIVTTGDFNLADLRRMVESLLSSPEWRPGIATLFDHRQLRFGDAGFDEMLEMKSIHSSNDARIGNGKSAGLMRSSTDYGLGRQFQNLARGKVSARIRIFQDEAEAVAWLLDVPETSQRDTHLHVEAALGHRLGPGHGRAPSAAGPTAPRMLVVDDLPEARALYEMVLSRAGYLTRSAASAAEALEAAADFDPDVVLVDLYLPERRDGEEAIRLVSERQPGRAVIVITGHLAVSADAGELARELGVGYVHRKSAGWDGLLAAVGAASGRGRGPL